MDDIIITENLTHQFVQDEWVLNQVNLKIKTGEIFGLLGPSGAGKTTLIKILTGQLKPTLGQAKLLGVDVMQLGEVEHQQIGAMLDNYGLYERLTVADNLIFYADLFQIPRSSIDELLKDFGLYEAKKTVVSKCSKGMKNRLSLARALMNHGKILFLDEPTAGLDPVTTQQIHAILRKQKEKGVTIFLTTHQMVEAESLCDHIALLSHGKIIEYGHPQDICMKYNRLKQLHVVLETNEKVILENGFSSADIIKEYLEYNQIKTIHSTEPTLETVFIECTGKGLGEDESYTSNF